MSSLLGNIFGLADKTKAGVKSPPIPNTFGEEKRSREICRERWWGGHGLCHFAMGDTGFGQTHAITGTHASGPFGWATRLHWT